jgi:hypothetical protein
VGGRSRPPPGRVEEQSASYRICNSFLIDAK